jgi:sigma-B regulation protein RsbU (phosphoserine phosphatase)
MNGRSTAFFIFDVTGHGLGPALLTAIGKISLGSRLKGSPSPGEALRGINQDLCACAPDHMFATAFLLILDAATGEGRYALAAHPFPFLYRAADRRVEEMNGGGMLLGVVRDAAYPDYSIRLLPGDAVLFHTDGLPESMDRSRRLYGRERIAALLEEHGGRPCADLLGRLLADQASFLDGADRRDDVCLLALKFRGGPP